MQKGHTIFLFIEYSYAGHQMKVLNQWFPKQIFGITLIVKGGTEKSEQKMRKLPIYDIQPIKYSYWNVWQKSYYYLHHYDRFFFYEIFHNQMYELRINETVIYQTIPIVRKKYGKPLIYEAVKFPVSHQSLSLICIYWVNFIPYDCLSERHG